MNWTESRACVHIRYVTREDGEGPQWAAERCARAGGGVPSNLFTGAVVGAVCTGRKNDRITKEDYPRVRKPASARGEQKRSIVASNFSCVRVLAGQVS